MDFESNYEIARVADFIRTGNYTRVALQFPDKLLKDSTKVVTALREKLLLLQGSCRDGDEEVENIGLYVMADTAYGSCCVDEVGASHINAECVIHYGHTCLSPTSTLPAFFVFGKASISASNCAQKLCNYISLAGKHTLVLYGLEYAHAIPEVKDTLIVESSKLSGSTLEIHFADVLCLFMNPSETFGTCIGHLQGVSSRSEGCDKATSKTYSIGGLTWTLPEDCRMEDYLLVWVGPDSSAFANVVLTFNGCEIVRYDAKENYLITDLSHQKRILKRRYYLVEKAKDANIVGILVGTLGVDGYLHMINQMKELITGAGKKVYTFVMGRPNPAKLANFPECDVFVYVSCAQTTLLDSKEFLAPIITPFEAMLAFNRESEWTGAYVMEFRDLIASSPVDVKKGSQEARFSFLQGGYIEDFDLENGSEGDEDGALALVNMSEKALLVRGKDPLSRIKGTAKSGAEFLATRSFQGLDIQNDNLSAEPFLIGRSGKASGYEHEKINQ